MHSKLTVYIYTAVRIRDNFDKWKEINMTTMKRVIHKESHCTHLCTQFSGHTCPLFTFLSLTFSKSLIVLHTSFTWLGSLFPNFSTILHDTNCSHWPVTEHFPAVHWSDAHAQYSELCCRPALRLQLSSQPTHLPRLCTLHPFLLF